jgi:hypothetical protein
MALFGWYRKQADIKTAFLHRDIEQEVYITILEGFDMTLLTNKTAIVRTVLRVNKALYGLK